MSRALDQRVSPRLQLRLECREKKVDEERGESQPTPTDTRQDKKETVVNEDHPSPHQPLSLSRLLLQTCPDTQNTTPRTPQELRGNAFERKEDDPLFFHAFSLVTRGFKERKFCPYNTQLSLLVALPFICLSLGMERSRGGRAGRSRSRRLRRSSLRCCRRTRESRGPRCLVRVRGTVVGTPRLRSSTVGKVSSR